MSTNLRAIGAVGIIVLIPLVDLLVSGRRGRSNEQILVDFIRNITYLCIGGIILAPIYYLTIIVFAVISLCSSNSRSAFRLCAYWICPFGKSVVRKTQTGIQTPDNNGDDSAMSFCFFCFIKNMKMTVWSIVSLPSYLLQLFWSVMVGLICCNSSQARIFAEMEELIQDPFNTTVTCTSDHTTTQQLPQNQHQIHLAPTKP
jgi:hypothetical protein